jgi:hypothetical protein
LFAKLKTEERKLKKTTEMYLTDLFKKFPNNKEKYDYASTVYTGCSDPITVFCKKCGKYFTQKASYHLAGCGCRICGRGFIRNNGVPYTTETFIAEAKKVHGEEYDYSLTEFVNTTVKVQIIHKACGDVFEINPIDHLNGQRHGRCFGNIKYTNDTFIEKARKAHGEKYDYSLVEIDTVKSVVKIICPLHGIFEQIAGDHLENHGCKKCANELKSTSKRFSKEQWLQKVFERNPLNKEKYDYSDTVYINCRTDISFRCKKCGNVTVQNPKYHFNGGGCYSCKQSRGQDKIACFLKKNNIEYISEYSTEKCKNIRKLRFDFFLPKYNMVIEYQGEQHFKPVKVFGGEKAFQRNSKNDQIKRDFCLKENIKELEISFKDHHSVDSVLEAYFSQFLDRTSSKLFPV